MVAKMADFVQKYVQLYNAGYCDAIIPIVMAEVHKPGSHPWNDRTVSDKQKFKMAAKMMD